MLLRMLRAERMKLRHAPVWLAFIGLPLVPAVIGTFNYAMNAGILQEEWYSLWTQHTLFSCLFFLPVLLGIYCAYLLRLEHSGHNWNAVRTAPVSTIAFYLAKLASASAMVVLTQVWTGALFILSGWLCGLRAPIPPELPEWLLYGAAGGIVLCAAQLALSLMIRSFAVPVGLALMGGVAGFAALAQGYGVFFPYSLLSLGMRANQPGGPMQCSPLAFAVSCLVYLTVFALWSVAWIKRRDVATW